MGRRFEFICEGCDYRAEVSGGKDRGLIAAVETMVCGNCKELVDVVLGRPGDEFPIIEEPELARELGVAQRCPRCDGTDVTPWRSRRCPRCGNTMKKGDALIHWD